MPNTTRLLELALKGLEAERAKIDDEIAEIKSQLNHGPATAKIASTGSSTPKRKTMSAAARRKISEAMKRRYAAMNKTASEASPIGKTGGLTAAGRKRLSDLMKKRWAERRKGKTK